MTLMEMREAFEDEAVRKTGSYSAFFSGRAMTYRLWLIIAIAFFSQYAGNWLAGGFTVITNAQFGFKTAEQQLSLSIANSVLGFIAGQIGASFCEKIGRRTMIIYGTMGFIGCWTIILICLQIFNANEELTGVGVAGWIVEQVFGLIYCFTWLSLNALYPAEILPYSARAKGLALCQLFINMSGVIQNFVFIYGVDAWGWKFDSFFLFFNIFALVIEYFFFVETRGYSLEKIDIIFNTPNPVKKSISDVRTVVEVTEISGDKDRGYYLTYSMNDLSRR
ncbi:hypothetical protein HK100_001430 [Physocladia obscura]|uniref:Major facilitator superfamily (MFS) profile domain-containing protein n=1 Tax=Physocladia obscura TaxID=109957 RepID=A0AAD5SWT7_9FUNG|nr:hypothetical protein HK100_001430 [Physocladia obscura]